MKNISDLLERKLTPFALKLSQNIYIGALKDGFAVLLPVMIVGSFFTLILNFPVPAVTDFLNSVFGTSWSMILSKAYQVTVPLLALLSTLSITYFMTVRIKGDIIPTLVLNFMLFLMFTPSASYVLNEETVTISGSYVNSYMGAKGYFLAMILGLLIPMLFKKLCSIRFLNIKLPDSVPPNVLTSFLVLIPTAIMLLLGGLLQYAISFLSDKSIFEYVYTLIQTPIREIVGTSYLGGLISVFFTYLAWFFGLHGGQLVNPINNIVFGELMPANIAAFAAGESIPNFFTGTPFFEAFTKIGGGGNVLALIIAILLVAKTSQYKEIAKAGLLPSLFNISEPIVFGLPVVLNPILIIPFLIAPMVSYTIAYFISSIGAIAPMVIQVPWTIPVGIYMYMSTAGDILAALLQIGMLVVSVLIYIPFIRLSEKVYVTEEKNSSTDAAN